MAVKKKNENKATENTENVGATDTVVEDTVVEPADGVVEDVVEDIVDDPATTENKTDEDGGEDTGITVDPEPTPEEAPVNEGKKVKIKPNCNYRFYYGTTWYTLCKDVIMTVPVEVKERLQAAGKLSAL